LQAVLAVLSIACLPAGAQLVSGNLSGTVYDVSGAIVPNAAVIAHNDATGVENTTTSTSTGEYRIVNLPGGTYTVIVTAPGFTKAELKNVQIELNVTATANISLQIGKSVETVEVSASAVAIDTSTAQLQNTFESQQMMELPTASSGSGH
jgi:hypothetical protein